MSKSSLFFCTLLLIVIVFALADAELLRKTFIIRVERDAKPSIFPTHKHWYESTLRSLSPTAIHDNSSDSADVSTVIHTYDTVFHGFSAKLSTSEAQRLETLSGIVALIPEQVRHLHTTRSPEFLGLKTSDSAGLLKDSDFGSDLVQPAPLVASFSARGPNPETPEILKPDVIAPGLNILAGWPDGVGPSGIPSDKRRTEFNILSGTSMACPHVSGLAALLKAAHPEWSPAAIRSALMTTAYTVDNRGETMLDESTGNSSTVMDYGAGHVHPQKAMDPGLIYDLSSYDYVDFLCNSNYTTKNVQLVTRKYKDCSGAKRAGHIGNLNYPSLSAVFQQYGKKNKTSTHFIRTVTNVGESNSVYEVTINPPKGVVVTVQPERLAFRRVGQKLNFLVRVQVRKEKLSAGNSVLKSGSIVWSDGKHDVISPVVVTIQQPL
ncbi:subtilisin-like protease SBT1.5 [Olea europaea var. sylvestris]|uniref:subtilisin-like protease SBT1.5 n=1 Tax=Olea europaea var. sylvestris TaxID=158386 RepID=UPI000C1D2934|nr:subtilisin-like protease SBT1.5 [Olea europaea var. sylvestris]